MWSVMGKPTAHNCHGKISLLTAKSISPRQNQFHYGKINFTRGKISFTHDKINFTRGKIIFIHGKISFTAKSIAKRASDVMTQTNKPEWRTIFLKHFLTQPVFLKHIFETKTLPRFPLVLSDHADVVGASRGYNNGHSNFRPRALRYSTHDKIHFTTEKSFSFTAKCISPRQNHIG